MAQRRTERLRQANLVDYEQEYKSFNWEDVERFLGLEGDGWNIAEVALNRHGVDQEAKTAFRFDYGTGLTSISYGQLQDLTNKFAGLIRSLGVPQGGRVAVYLPMQPEFYISFLGTVKAGVIVIPMSPVFMSDAVTEILRDSEATLVVTTWRLLARIAWRELPSLEQIILVDEQEPPRAEVQPSVGGGQIVRYAEAMKAADSKYVAPKLGKESPMMLLYTSGSTGKPKGVLHVHGGLTQFYQTGKWVLDLQPDDIYWCTSEPSWIPGISYGIWAPLLHGVTSVIYCGEFRPEIWYGVLSKNYVTLWYTTPTSLRKLMNFGPANPAKRNNLSALRHVLTVGEPLNPGVIRWGGEALGLQICDTYWMTETGGQLIANFRTVPVKPGSMGKPIPGIEAGIVNERGKELPAWEVGQLAIKAGWPAMMRGIWKDEAKFREYFGQEPWYLTGDLAYRDTDGYYWFQGRVDDVIKKASERIGPFEIESKLVGHPAVLEAGVIGKPDALLGEIIKAFIVLRPGYEWGNELQADIQRFIEERLGPHMVPREIEPRAVLPRTRNGKILRRVLKAQEMGLPYSDVYTPED